MGRFLTQVPHWFHAGSLVHLGLPEKWCTLQGELSRLCTVVPGVDALRAGMLLNAEGIDRLGLGIFLSLLGQVGPCHGKPK